MKFLDDTKIPDQPYPELREVLSIFADEIAAELRENLVGIYLVGSLASGDFDADSDVDFLVVTNTELTEADMKPLQEIQFRIHDIDCYPAKHLEGSYISIADLNDSSIVGQKELYYFDNGSTEYEQSTHDNQWHVRWILRERGITLVGPKPELIVQAIPSNELRNEMKMAMLQVKQLFEEEIDHPLSFFNSRFGQSFAVLTYCRMLQTFHTGTVQSKKAAVTWAKQFVAPERTAIIEQAWQEREGVRFLVKIRQRAEQSLLYETLEFMKYVVSKMDSIGAQARVESFPKESA
ncbi:MAG TPA: aminoglycoside adenylyltransferase domain-containing protein [Anaerolineales bacterium]|nr:aminoglycoside adenylyltransferase domain-containing protein [Anaerolineales bacterium]